MEFLRRFGVDYDERYIFKAGETPLPILAKLGACLKMSLLRSLGLTPRGRDSTKIPPLTGFGVKASLIAQGFKSKDVGNEKA